MWLNFYGLEGKVPLLVSLVQSTFILNPGPRPRGSSSGGYEGAVKPIRHLHRHLCSAQLFKVLGIQDEEEVAFILEKERQH